MVEASLAELHNFAPKDVPALRSRFGMLQRGGLLPKPGRGRLEYGPDELNRILLAFELAQMDVSPTTVLRLIRQFWDRPLREIFLKAARARMNQTPDVVLILAGISAMDGPEQAILSVGHTTMDKLAQSLALALDGQGNMPSRALILNLSERLSRFHNALANYHLKPEMLAELKPKSKPAAKR
jgi:hypothetical protein